MNLAFTSKSPTSSVGLISKITFLNLLKHNIWVCFLCSHRTIFHELGKGMNSVFMGEKRQRYRFKVLLQVKEHGLPLLGTLCFGTWREEWWLLSTALAFYSKRSHWGIPQGSCERVTSENSLGLPRGHCWNLVDKRRNRRKVGWRESICVWMQDACTFENWDNWVSKVKGDSKRNKKRIFSGKGRCCIFKCIEYDQS